MNQHTTFGWQILHGTGAALLETAAVIAASHHEWWDGTGYPAGLRASEIPLEGRIVAIADVFDALTSARRYKRAFTVREAVETMTAERGTHFDPELLDLFLADVDELVAVQRRFGDAGTLPAGGPQMAAAPVSSFDFRNPPYARPAARMMPSQAPKPR